MSNILVVSHGITSSTGFANQNYLFSRALKDAGNNIFTVHRDYRGEPLTFGPGSGTPSGKDMEGIMMLPWGQAQWAEDVLPYYIERYHIDYVLTLGDIWCYQYIAKIPREHPWKWLAHYVFDTENIVGFWVECIKNPDMVIVPALNSFNLIKELRAPGEVVYIPHGIDTNIFTPCTPEEKKQFRKEMGLPEDKFIITCVAHNQTRKKLNRLLMAFNLVAQKNKDVHLHFHSAPKEQTGWDLGMMAKDWNINDRVTFSDKATKMMGDLHVSQAELRKLYCAGDIHALPTGGEGFGIPLVEAMACGIPNVTTDYTTAKEFLGENERGLRVPYEGLDTHFTGGLWANVSIAKLAEAIQMLKDNPAEVRIMGQRSRQFVVPAYDNEVVKKIWKDLFANIETRFAKKPEDTGIKAVRI